jgi:hypothetical protein
VEQSNKHSNRRWTATTNGEAKATNQAISNEYQHRLTDNSFHFMNEARRGENEKKEVGDEDGEFGESSCCLHVFEASPKPLLLNSILLPNLFSHAKDYSCFFVFIFNLESSWQMI